jgi:hypothetical protein
VAALVEPVAVNTTTIRSRSTRPRRGGDAPMGSPGTQDRITPTSPTSPTPQRHPSPPHPSRPDPPVDHQTERSPPKTTQSPQHQSRVSRRRCEPAALGGGPTVMFCVLRRCQPHHPNDRRKQPPDSITREHNSDLLAHDRAEPDDPEHAKRRAAITGGDEQHGQRRRHKATPKGQTPGHGSVVACCRRVVSATTRIRNRSSARRGR